MNGNNYLIDQVACILDDDSIRYERICDGQAIQSKFKGDNGQYRVVFGAISKPSLLFMNVQIPLFIKEERRPEIIEAIVRINHDLLFGRFDLDMADGEMSFYISIPLLEATLSTAQFRSAVATAFHEVDRYHRAFGRLLYDYDLIPAAAIAEIEMAK